MWDLTLSDVESDAFVTVRRDQSLNQALSLTAFISQGSLPTRSLNFWPFAKLSFFLLTFGFFAP